MLIHFLSLLLLERHLLTEELTLRVCLSSMGPSILLKCYILHSFSSSNNSNRYPLSHTKANKVIRTPAFQVVPLHPKNIYRTSTQGCISVAVVEPCKVFLLQRTSLLNNCNCSQGSNRKTNRFLINLASLRMKLVVKRAHQQLIAEGPVQI